jgi:ribosomal protein S27E
MLKVNKRTRAGKNGKIVICPFCAEKQIVYHFSFVACTCQACKKLVDKYEWLVADL